MQDKPMEKNAARGQAPRRAGVVFLSEDARRTAARVLELCAGEHVLLAAPEALLDATWVQAAASSAAVAAWQCWPTVGVFRNPLRSPLDFLAQIDTLWVVTSAAGTDAQSAVDAMPPGLQDLLLLAHREGLPTFCRNTSGGEVEGWAQVLEADPEVAERLDAAREKRLLRMARLGVLRLKCEPDNDPLWDEQGMGVSANALDVPLVLLRAAAAWQHRFEATAPLLDDMDSEDALQWLRTQQDDGVALARQFHAALMDKGLEVQLWLGPLDGWVKAQDLDEASGNKWDKH